MQLYIKKVTSYRFVCVGYERSRGARAISSRRKFQVVYVLRVRDRFVTDSCVQVMKGYEEREHALQQENSNMRNALGVLQKELLETLNHTEVGTLCKRCVVVLVIHARIGSLFLLPSVGCIGKVLHSELLTPSMRERNGLHSADELQKLRTTQTPASHSG